MSHQPQAGHQPQNDNILIMHLNAMLTLDQPVYFTFPKTGTHFLKIYHILIILVLSICTTALLQVLKRNKSLLFF